MDARDRENAREREAREARNRAAGLNPKTGRPRFDKLQWQRNQRAAQRGELPPRAPVEGQDQQTIRFLQGEVARLKKGAINTAVIREEILKLARTTPPVPDWLSFVPKRRGSSPGIPTLLLSDLHWGEVVDPLQIGGVNEYNLEIAKRRLKNVTLGTVNVLKNHMVSTNYEGIVVAMGGDSLSGDIHEELTITNEVPSMVALVDLLGEMVWVLETMAENFGKVFVPCVAGNHTRTNPGKPRAKERAHLSFDWLLYVLLEKHFKKDDRITFLIPDGPDAQFNIHAQRYLLTHGDQFSGGDGMIGPLGPITRGDHRKRTVYGQTNRPYDTLVMGHFHTLIQMPSKIVNGSLVGYNEYATTKNFPFEVPRQALWLTHPERGITFQVPIDAEDGMKPTTRTEWVSWPKVRRTA